MNDQKKLQKHWKNLFPQYELVNYDIVGVEKQIIVYCRNSNDNLHKVNLSSELEKNKRIGNELEKQVNQSNGVAKLAEVRFKMFEFKQLILELELTQIANKDNQISNVTADSHKKRRLSRIEKESLYPKIIDDLHEIYDSGKYSKDETFSTLSEQSTNKYERHFTPNSLRGIFQRKGEKFIEV